MNGGMQEWFICQVSKTLGVNFAHESSNLSPTAHFIRFVRALRWRKLLYFVLCTADLSPTANAYLS